MAKAACLRCRFHDALLVATAQVHGHGLLMLRRKHFDPWARQALVTCSESPATGGAPDRQRTQHNRGVPKRPRLDWSAPDALRVSRCRSKDHGTAAIPLVLVKLTSVMSQQPPRRAHNGKKLALSIRVRRDPDGNKVLRLVGQDEAGDGSEPVSDRRAPGRPVRGISSSPFRRRGSRIPHRFDGVDRAGPDF